MTVKTALALSSIAFVFATMASRVGADEIKPASEAQIAEWISQLDAVEFQVREEASKKLSAAGKAAIPVLVKAVSSKKLELNRRAFAILKGHIDKGEQAVKDAATTAMLRLSQSKNTGIAKRAKTALQPKKTRQQEAQDRMRARFGLPRAAGGRRAGVRRMSTRIVDGNKVIDVTEADRQIKMVITKAGSISIEVTEDKKGKATTTKYKAKSVDELKTKHPDAHALYTKYAVRPIRVRRAGVGLVVRRGPDGRMVIADTTQDALDSIKKAEKQLATVAEQIKQLLKETKDATVLKKTLDQLKAAQQQLSEAKSSLGG